MQTPTLDLLSAIGNQLRILSIEATTAAGSGHPSSCCSAADLVAALFFDQMRFDPKNPRDDRNDRFVLSKGHAAPLLYAAWAETGHVSHDELMSLRKLDSPFEGHPTPRLDFVDVATGSLGQGLSAAIGMLIASKLDQVDSRVYVLLGDGEMAEGSVWEAISFAGICQKNYRTNRLTAIVDVNRYGQNSKTAFGHHTEVYQKRFEAFGWSTVVIDGHDMHEILRAYSLVGQTEKPLAIIAKTIKGQGIPEFADKPNWHGKPLNAEDAKKAIEILKPFAKSAIGSVEPRKPQMGSLHRMPFSSGKASGPLPYSRSDQIAPRKAYGNALARLGTSYPDLVVLDGDVGNSTFTDEFAKKFRDRFVECYIAEQNMVGMAGGLSARGKIPCVATFAAFLLRALDQIRMSAVSRSNLKLTGTHAGVSIGEDGPSQMGLEDIAALRAIHGTTVFSPCDAVSTERLTELMLENPGMFYLRAARAASPILYSPTEKFEIGGAKILRQSSRDQLTVVATGVTVFETLKAHDELAKEGISISVIDAYCIKPLAKDLILSASKKTDFQIISVEDHNTEGGLGDAIAGELSRFGARVSKLAVRELPRSGEKAELLSKYGIDSAAICKTARELVAGSKRQRINIASP